MPYLDGTALLEVDKVANEAQYGEHSLHCANDDGNTVTAFVVEVALIGWRKSACLHERKSSDLRSGVSVVELGN